MSVPEYQDLMLPILNAVSDGQEHSVGQITEKLVSVLSLTEEERKQLLGGSGQTVIANRVAWGKTQLKRAGLLTTPTKGTVSITDEGKAVLAKRPGRIDNDFLRQFPAYQEWVKGHKDDRPDH